MLPMTLVQHPSSGTCTLRNPKGQPCPLLAKSIKTRCAQTALVQSQPLDSLTPIVIMIGRNPGLDEDSTGLPFQGRLSERFWSAWIPGSKLADLSTLFLTNIARCYHVDGQAPKPAAFSMCRTHLIPDLHSINSMGGGPIFLLTMGAEATTHTYALGGQRAITLTKAFSRQGYPLVIDGIKTHVYSTFHPAFCEREERHIYAVQDHLALLTDALRGTRPLPSKPTFSPPRSPRP
jgi:uracil-DNA glycosylase family 4